MCYKQILFSLMLSLPLVASQSSAAMSHADSNLFVAALSGEDISQHLSNEVSAETLGQALCHAAQVGNMQALDQLLANGIVDRIAPTVFARTFNRLTVNQNLSEETIIAVINRLFTCPRARANIAARDAFAAIHRLAANNQCEDLIGCLANVIPRLR